MWLAEKVSLLRLIARLASSNERTDLLMSTSPRFVFGICNLWTSAQLADSDHRQTTLCVRGLRESMRVVNKVLKIAHLIRAWLPTVFPRGSQGCLPFVRIIRLGRALINGKGFSKITKPTKRKGAYHLQFNFPSLFSADERLETGKFCKW